MEPAAESIDLWKILVPNELVELSLSKGKQRGRCWPSGVPFFLAATGRDGVGGGSCFLIFKYFGCWWLKLRARAALLTLMGAAQASGGAKLSHSPPNFRFTVHGNMPLMPSILPAQLHSFRNLCTLRISSKPEKTRSFLIWPPPCPDEWGGVYQQLHLCWILLMNADDLYMNLILFYMYCICSHIGKYLFTLLYCWTVAANIHNIVQIQAWVYLWES